MAYGFALGWWRSPQMAMFISAKFPIVFIGSAVIVSAFGWMCAKFLGVDMTYGGMAGHAFRAMPDSACVLLSLTPVSMLMILSGAPDIVLGSPDAATRAQMRFAHATMMLMHILVLASAGVAGIVGLYTRLKTRFGEGHWRRIRKTIACWLAAFAVAGCQIGWIMRPLMGSPNIKVEFLREDALEKNFLESVFTQLVPHFINKGVINKTERQANERANE